MTYTIHDYIEELRSEFQERLVEATHEDWSVETCGPVAWDIQYRIRSGPFCMLTPCYNIVAPVRDADIQTVVHMSKILRRDSV